MHPKNRCLCKVDPNDAAAVEAHLKTCEKRPESFDYCACEVDQGDSDEAKAQRVAHNKDCGRTPPSAAVPVRHAKHAASEEVDRCHVCSISTGELEAIKSTGLVPVQGHGANAHACPSHADCYYDPANYWGETRDGVHRTVTMDSATGEIIDPSARTVVRPHYEEKSSAAESNG